MKRRMKEFVEDVSLFIS